MKHLKESPFFFLLLLSGILFTILAAIGKNNIYRDQQYHPEKGPLLSILFTAMNEDIYPWQLFTDGRRLRQRAVLPIRQRITRMVKTPMTPLTVQKIQVKETTQLLAVIPQQETVLSVEITLHRKRKMMLPVVCHRRSHLTVRTDRSL